MIELGAITMSWTIEDTLRYCCWLAEKRLRLSVGSVGSDDDLIAEHGADSLNLSEIIMDIEDVLLARAKPESYERTVRLIVGSLGCRYRCDNVARTRYGARLYRSFMPTIRETHG